MGNGKTKDKEHTEREVSDFLQEINEMTIQAMEWGQQTISPYLPKITGVLPSDAGAAAEIEVRDNAVLLGAEVELDVEVDRPMTGDESWDYVQVEASDGVTVEGELDAKAQTVTATFNEYSASAQDLKTVSASLFDSTATFEVVVSPFWTIWEKYPTQHGDHHPCALEKKGYTAQCAMRLSEALEAAQISTATFQGGRCWSCSGTPSGRGHILRAAALAKWIDRHRDLIGVGKKEVKTNVTYKDFTGRFGIVYFKDFWARNDAEETSENYTGDHIDIWNGEGDWHGKGKMGSGSHDDYDIGAGSTLNYSPTLSYFRRSAEVWFWPLH